MNKIIVTLLLVSLATVTGLATEEQAQARSIIGNTSDGYEEGKDQGVNDSASGNGHNSECPPNDSLVWCAGYKAGYEVGYLSANNIELEAEEDDD